MTSTPEQVRRMAQLLDFYVQRTHHRDRQYPHTDTEVQQCPVAKCKEVTELLREIGYWEKENEDEQPTK